MNVRSYTEMLQEYGIEDLEADDKEDRKKMLTRYNYSVIFEGDFLEFDNVEAWVKKNIVSDPLNFLFYGKLGYNYGFFEIFLTDPKYVEELSNAIPNIMTS